MLVVDAEAFDCACEALMFAATRIRDASGLRVVPDMPTRAPSPETGSPIVDRTDRQRVRAITLGALVALLNGPVRPSDEIPIPGFGGR